MDAVGDNITAREQLDALSGTVRVLGYRLGYDEATIESWLPVAA